MRETECWIESLLFRLKGEKIGIFSCDLSKSSSFILIRRASSVSRLYILWSSSEQFTFPKNVRDEGELMILSLPSTFPSSRRRPSLVQKRTGACTLITHAHKKGGAKVKVCTFLFICWRTCNIVPTALRVKHANFRRSVALAVIACALSSQLLESAEITNAWVIRGLEVISV